jgi:hypothetical protein
MGLLGRRLFRVALVAAALAGGGGAVWADGTMPDNGGLVALPAPLPRSVQDSLLLADGNSSIAVPSQKFDLPSGRLDFFSVRPESSSGDFTSLLRGGMAGGGLKFRLKW